LLGILCRNLGTFYATTLFTLYALKYSQQAEYNPDKRIATKLSILNLDVVMTHTMPFQCFKQYIQQHAPHYDVYLNLYCLIELYRNKISTLLIKAKNIKSQMGDESFDFREVDNGEFKLS